MTLLRLILLTIMALTLAALPAGCASNPARPAAEATLAPADGRLLPGDVVEVKFYYAPELNDSQRIRPDGKLSLQLVGEVTAAGLTPAELTETLETAYAKHLRFAGTTVVLLESPEQRVYVNGAVLRPGVLPLTGRLTLLQAVAAAGGLDLITAEAKNVIVIRQHDQKRIGYKVNLADALAGAPSEPFVLQAQDIVYVPRTTIVNVNQFVDQYIGGVIPRTGFFYSQPSGAGTIGLDTSAN